MGAMISLFYPFRPEGKFFGPVTIAIVGGFLGGGIILIESLPARTSSAARAIGWIFGPGVGVLLIAGALCLLRFPLTDAAHRRIQTELLARRRERETGGK